MKTFKPLLASPSPSAESLAYPLLASPKLDGIRCITRGGVALSRTLKPIPNRFIQSALSIPELSGLDGELIVGKPTAHNAMQLAMSGVMSQDGTPDFTYYVFDRWTMAAEPFTARLVSLATLVSPNVKVLPQTLINSPAELNAFEADCLAQGYEGVMVRSLNGLYKFGRSTAKEGILLKVKRFSSDEARVVGFEPLYRNDNETTISETGNTVRSSHQANKFALDTLGALVVERVSDGVRFCVGTGFDAAVRKQLWLERETLVGKVLTYKHFEIGAKEAPRFPVFVSFRDKMDFD